MKTFLPIAFFAILPTSPAWAGAVNGWGAADGFGAVPVMKGTWLLDMRVNGVEPGVNLTAPTVNLVYGVANGIEAGVGTNLNVNGVGSSTVATSVDPVYPWVRAALPFSNKLINTGVMVGTLVPGYNTASGVLPGVTGLMDFNMGGGVISSLNLGYARQVASGTNWTDANISFTVPVGALTFYEEQFVNYPVSGYSDGGVRGQVCFPLREKVVLDVNLAGLWQSGSSGPAWSLNPNVGLCYTF
jgi:hypothetical protein